MFHSAGQNQLWPTNGRIDCITPAVQGVPNASQRRTRSTLAEKRPNRYITRDVWGWVGGGGGGVHSRAKYQHHPASGRIGHVPLAI